MLWPLNPFVRPRSRDESERVQETIGVFCTVVGRSGASRRQAHRRFFANVAAKSSRVSVACSSPRCIRTVREVGSTGRYCVDLNRVAAPGIYRARANRGKALTRFHLVDGAPGRTRTNT